MMINWQPIKTCPDGVEVLLHFCGPWRPVVRNGTKAGSVGATYWAPLNLPEEKDDDRG